VHANLAQLQKDAAQGQFKQFGQAPNALDELLAEEPVLPWGQQAARPNWLDDVFADEPALPRFNQPHLDALAARLVL
jgi:hypothetical protein